MVEKALICQTCYYNDTCLHATGVSAPPLVKDGERQEEGIRQRVKCIEGQAHWTGAEKEEAINQLRKIPLVIGLLC